MPEPVTQIIMEGEMVREFRTELIKEVRIADFIPHIEYTPPITLGIIPSTCRFIHWDQSDPAKKKVQILAELPPAVRTSTYNRQRIQLSYPWTYFLLDFTTSGDPLEGKNWAHTNTRVYWARQQVTGPKSLIYTALVYNCAPDGSICWGSTYVDAGETLSARVDRLLSTFYRSEFTHPSGSGSPWQSMTGRDTWDKWAEETKKNPAAFLDFPEWNLDGKTKFKHTNPMTSRPVMDIFGTLSDRSIPVQVEGRIPDLIVPMTFGRAEEWIAELKDEDVTRLETAIANRRADAANGNG